MSRSAGVDVLFLIFAGVPALLFLCQPVFPGAGIYQGAASQMVFTYLASLTKLSFLALASRFAFLSAGRFERDNPIRPAWFLMAGGMLCTFLGQASLAPYQLYLGTPSPFPSVADLFFVLSYVFLVPGLIASMVAYRKAGLPIGTAAERWGVGLGVGLVCTAVGFAILRPIALQPAPPLEKALNLGYPILDFVLLIPTSLLLRIGLRFRGGQAGRVWLTLLAGFLVMCVGDVAFAYFSAFSQEQLFPIVHAMFILAYALLARGVVSQHALLAD